MALAITPPDVLETFRSLERLQPRFETALWLEPCRAADEYSQLWKRHTLTNFQPLIQNQPFSIRLKHTCMLI